MRYCSCNDQDCIQIHKWDVEGHPLEKGVITRYLQNIWDTDPKNTTVRIAWTGHRPEKLGGYSRSNPIYISVRDRMKNKIEQATKTFGEVQWITGGALGVDQMAAELLSEMGLSYIVAAPCHRLSDPWPPHAQKHYNEICRNADPELAQLLCGDKSVRQGVVYVHDGPYTGPSLMQDRNKWMVDNADFLIAVWDGTPGGTANCLRYALHKWYGANKTASYKWMAENMEEKKDLLKKIRWIKV